MAVFRVEKNKSYTVMSNHHLRNRTLSLKAKGLLSQMLSLPEDWDYTLAGLASINICKDKCQPGAVNVACPVCKKDMTECKGIAPTPTPKPAPTSEPETPPAPVNKGTGMGGIILIAVLAVAGGAFFYIKRGKGGGKAKQAPAFDEMDGFEDDAFDDDEDDMDEPDEET
jgi:hypothetical protein